MHRWYTKRNSKIFPIRPYGPSDGIVPLEQHGEQGGRRRAFGERKR